MFTLQIASDLHIEYQNDEKVDPYEYITPSSDILILAGDIGSLYKLEQLYDFLYIISKDFKYVLYVPGNHEYYKPCDYNSIHMKELKNIFEKLEHEISNLIVLDQKCVQIGNVCIAGATLWSDIQCDLPKYIVRIHNITKSKYMDMFAEDLEYITDVIQYCNNKKIKLVCVTHHPPTMKVCKGRTNNRNKFESLYGSNLDHMLNTNDVDTWVCGHVHDNFDFVTDGGTRLVSNQKGKPKDKIKDYNKSFVIKINT